MSYGLYFRCECFHQIDKISNWHTEKRDKQLHAHVFCHYWTTFFGHTGIRLFYRERGVKHIILPRARIRWTPKRLWMVSQSPRASSCQRQKQNHISQLHIFGQAPTYTFGQAWKMFLQAHNSAHRFQWKIIWPSNIIIARNFEKCTLNTISHREPMPEDRPVTILSMSDWTHFRKRHFML